MSNLRNGFSKAAVVIILMLCAGMLWAGGAKEPSAESGKGLSVRVPASRRKRVAKVKLRNKRARGSLWSRVLKRK